MNANPETAVETTANTELLTKEVTAEIDKWVAKFPADQKQSAVLAALTAAQKQNNGYLTEQLMQAVADYLDMPHIAVYEVATFYSMFNLEPVGKHQINVCINISCQLCGSQKIMRHLQDKLNINVGETTADGKFTLRGTECLAACTNAPMMRIGDHYHENLTPEKVDQILESLD